MAFFKQFALKLADIVDAAYGHDGELAQMTVDDYRLCIRIAYHADTLTARKFVQIAFELRAEI